MDDHGPGGWGEEREVPILHDIPPERVTGVDKTEKGPEGDIRTVSTVVTAEQLTYKRRIMVTSLNP